MNDTTAKGTADMLTSDTCGAPRSERSGSPDGLQRPPQTEELPADLPPTVAVFLAGQSIRTRQQAAICLACLDVHPDLLGAPLLSSADIVRALECLDVDLSAALADLSGSIDELVTRPRDGALADVRDPTVNGSTDNVNKDVR